MPYHVKVTVEAIETVEIDDERAAMGYSYEDVHSWEFRGNYPNANAKEGATRAARFINERLRGIYSESYLHLLLEGET